MWASKTERWMELQVACETGESKGPGVQKDFDSSISCSEAHFWVPVSRPQTALFSVYLCVSTAVFMANEKAATASCSFQCQ